MNADFVLTGRVCSRRGRIRLERLLLSLLAIIGLTTGCPRPHIQLAGPEVLSRSGLGFIQDGVTTREEVLSRLGKPSARFEGERILTYHFDSDKSGRWHLVSPQRKMVPGTPPGSWEMGDCCLVLVFGPDGILCKHSLVKAE